MENAEPLYMKITNELREKIYNEEIKVGERLPTEMELIEEYKVSRITAKRALEDLKNEGLITRVRGRGSYVSYNATKSSDVNNVYRKVISVLIPFSNSMGGVMNIISGISDVVRKQGYIVELHCAERTVEEMGQVLETLYKQQVAGIIYYPKADNDNLELMNHFYLDKFPVVTVDKYYESIPLSNVISDDKKGMYDATKYLLELGHRKIAFVTDVKIEEATTVRNRYYGYAQALHEYGIPKEEMYVKNENVHLRNDEEAEKFLQEILENGITAVCAINDYMASYLISYMRTHGVDVPNQVSVIGFDDLELNQFMEIPLTTVRQNMYKVGREAGKLLLRMIEEKKFPNVRKVIPTQLVVRGSCKAIK